MSQPQNQAQRAGAAGGSQANNGAGSSGAEDHLDPAAMRKPRDARLIHAVLANLGVRSYEDRVPLQLMDFAYRYTVGILTDAVALSEPSASSARANAAANSDGGVTLSALRLAISARLGQEFQTPLPKEFMMELAQERNRVALPRAERGYGLRLPPEQYCLTGTGWGMKEEWESEVEDEGDGGIEAALAKGDREGGTEAGGDTVMGEAEDEDMEEFEEVMMGES